MRTFERRKTQNGTFYKIVLYANLFIFVLFGKFLDYVPIMPTHGKMTLMDVSSNIDEIQPLIRPSPELALDIAEAIHARGLRVDMQVVAEKLGVGRTTLYRWVGGREQLIAELLARLTARAWDEVDAATDGHGLERLFRIAEAYMRRTSVSVPLREFAKREPQLALKIFLQADGPVPNALRDGILRSIRRHVPDFDRDANQELLDTCIQIGTALEYAPIVIGEEPSIDRAMRLIRELFKNYQRR